MTKNRKLFEEIDERSANTQDSPTETSSVGKEFGYVSGCGYWCHW